MSIRRETNKVWMVKVRLEMGDFWCRVVATDQLTGYRTIIFDGIARVWAENRAKEEGRTHTFYIPPWREWNRERIIHQAEILDTAPATVSMKLVSAA